MTYKLPANPDTSEYVDVCVRIPNLPEYVTAFLGAYTYFGRWVAWERTGDDSGAIAADVWLRGIVHTLDNWESCGNPPIEEDMTINVQVNCGSCGGGTPTTIYCVNQQGDVIITPQPPTEPGELPPSGDWPVDPLTDTVPEIFEDWTEFDLAACTAANALWFVARFFCVAAEALGDVLATAAAIIVLIIPLLPAAVVAAVGGATILEVVIALRDIVLSEQASDILNEAIAWLDERREWIICTIYEYRYNLPDAAKALAEDGLSYIEQTLTLDPGEQSGVFEFLDEVFPTSVIYKWLFGDGGLMDISEFGEPYDCRLCGLPTIADTDYAVLAVPTSLMVKTGDERVVPTFGNYQVTSSLTSLHYGQGIYTFTIQDVLDFHGITGTAVAVLARMDAASHYGYPVGTYTAQHDADLAPGELALWTIDSLWSEIQAIDSGDFLADFDHTAHPGQAFPTTWPGNHYFLDHNNQAYLGTITGRWFVVVRI